MNYTEKSSNNQEYPFKNLGNKQISDIRNYESLSDKSWRQHFQKDSGISKLVIKKDSQEIDKSFSSRTSEESVLVNREIGCPTSKYHRIYQKYNRKQIAQYSLTVDNTRLTNYKKGEKRTRLKRSEFNTKLSLQETLKTINKSLCSCGRDTHFQNQSGIVDIKETDTTRRLKGLKSCGSHSACPVCAAKLSSVRSKQLTDFIEAGRENNRGYMMMVATIQHQPGEALEITLNQVISMCKYIFSRKQWVKFRKETSCRYVHGGLENMVSFKNGVVDWHPHKNYILDFDISIEEVCSRLGLDSELSLRLYVSKMMNKLGQDYLDKNKIDKSLKDIELKQDPKTNRVFIKGGITASTDFNDGYIAKWGMSAEMTSGIYKDGRFNESFHPFVLLDFIDNKNDSVNDKQRYQCIKAFQEFVIASKGKWWFYFARGAVAYYNEQYGCEIKVKKDEEELLTLEDNGELIYSLTNQEWLLFNPTPRKIGFALSLDTKQEVLEFIYEHIEANRIKNIERRRE